MYGLIIFAYLSELPRHPLRGLNGAKSQVGGELLSGHQFSGLQWEK